MIALFLALASGLVLLYSVVRPVPAHAFPSHELNDRYAYFSGRVTAVSGPAADPSSFVLQTRNRPISLKVAVDGTLTAASAEAEVEGFVVGDYAAVLAQRTARSWTAEAIVYDVQQLDTFPTVSFSGSIVRVALDQRSLLVRLSSGELRRLVITHRTTFEVDGQSVASAPVFARNDVVEVVARLALRGWTAVQVNLRHATSSPM